MAGLKEGNTYRLISKYATDGEVLGVFTYAGQSEEGFYTFVSKNKFDATVSVIIAPGAINDYIVEEVNKVEGSDGSRRNRKAARATKKTRRNRRRSSRTRKS